MQKWIFTQLSLDALWVALKLFCTIDKYIFQSWKDVNKKYYKVNIFRDYAITLCYNFLPCFLVYYLYSIKELFYCNTSFKEWMEYYKPKFNYFLVIKYKIQNIA